MTHAFQEMNASTFNTVYKSDDTHSSPKNVPKTGINANKRKLFTKLEVMREEKELREAFEL